jgi:chemotaxis-related protein WspD
VHCRNCDRYSNAGRQILERPVPDEYRLEWRDRFAETKHAGESESNSVLIFRLGDEWLALDNRHVNEIIRMPAIHSLPHKEDTLIKGLVNIRGELKICVSIGSLLQLGKAQECHIVDHEIPERMIFVEKDDQSFVFPVSEVHGVHHYSDNALRATPDTVAKSRDTLTIGILSWNQQHVGILDSELLFYALARDL